jgi:hypothetical protein
MSILYFEGFLNKGLLMRGLRVGGCRWRQPPRAEIIENRESKIKTGGEVKIKRWPNRFDSLTVKTGFQILGPR